MNPLDREELEKNISSATVTFIDTGETYDLMTKPGSNCHFFKRFTVGGDYIQLRLHWSDLDHNGHPILDADFINKKNGKHRCLKGKRRSAHHTSPIPGKGRCYEWAFDGFSRQFRVKIVWLAFMIGNIIATDFLIAEIVPKEKNEDS